MEGLPSIKELRQGK